jgi:hypothetical protein
MEEAELADIDDSFDGGACGRSIVITDLRNAIGRIIRI